MAMKHTVKKLGKVKFDVREFSSIGSFMDYITTTQVSEHFSLPSNQSSINGTYKFTKTVSYDEALKLLEGGWDSGAQTLTKQVKIATTSNEAKKLAYDVVGFQVSVPRYMQGVPTSMVRHTTVQKKNKVITINKDISYQSRVDADTMMQYGVKLVSAIAAIEAAGYRVNLNVIMGTRKATQAEVYKIRIKSANERLNISKMAFPLAHPSMLRRFLLRAIEVSDTATKDFVVGYGAPVDVKDLKRVVGKDEYIADRFFNGDESGVLTTLSEK